jgi:uncharacterized membrane protein
MSLLKVSGLILAAYLAAGRTGSVATCLYLGLKPHETLIIALLMDLIQIPVYGLILTLSGRFIKVPERVRKWIDHRTQAIQRRIQSGPNWKRLSRYRPLAVIAVSIIPFRGFGVFSACILAFIMGYGRVAGTCLIMSGSLVGAVVTTLVFYHPARWLSGL